MSEANDGGPAFPVPQKTDYQGMIVEPEYSGMSLRDYFAAAALPELVRAALDLDHVSWDATAGHAYIIADAMLKERERK